MVPCVPESKQLLLSFCAEVVRATVTVNVSRDDETSQPIRRLLHGSGFGDGRNFSFDVFLDSRWRNLGAVVREPPIFDRMGRVTFAIAAPWRFGRKPLEGASIGREPSGGNLDVRSDSRINISASDVE